LRRVFQRALPPLAGSEVRPFPEQFTVTLPAWSYPKLPFLYSQEIELGVAPRGSPFPKPSGHPPPIPPRSCLIFPLSFLDPLRQSLDYCPSFDAQYETCASPAACCTWPPSPVAFSWRSTCCPTARQPLTACCSLSRKLPRYSSLQISPSSSHPPLPFRTFVSLYLGIGTPSPLGLHATPRTFALPLSSSVPFLFFISQEGVDVSRPIGFRMPAQLPAHPPKRDADPFHGSFRVAAFTPLSRPFRDSSPLV